MLDEHEQAHALDAAARGLTRWYRHAAPALAWLDAQSGSQRLQDEAVDVLEAVTTAADALAPIRARTATRRPDDLTPAQRLDAALRCLVAARTHLRRYLSRTPAPIFGEATVRARVDELKTIRIALQGVRDHHAARDARRQQHDG